MSTSNRSRARAAIFFGSALALSWVQCSAGGPGTLGDAGLSGDGSVLHDGGGDGATGACPSTPPTNGTACSLPDGTDCTSRYPQPGCECCSGSTYVCRGGKWSVTTAGGPPNYVVTCPTTVPDDNSSCGGSPCSGGAQTQCQYDCTTGKGANRSATCIGGVWHVSTFATSCIAEAGADAPDGG